MEIHLIRHTTPDIEKGICYGQSDLELALSFPEESNVILQKLPSSLDTVFTSPLKRCLQLAKLIPSPRFLEVSELQEMNFGEWELRPWSDIPKAELDPWMADFVNQRAPNGESMNVMADRVLSWFDHLSSLKLEKVAIVTHAGPIRIILSEINQTTLKEAFQLYSVDYGEVIRI